MVTIKAGNLKPGMVVVSGTGATRTVTGLPQACKARGYVLVATTGAPVNCHKDNDITIKAGA